MMMMKKLLSAAAIAAVALTGSQSLAAGGEAKAPTAVKWSWEGPFGKYDQAQLQRGFQAPIENGRKYRLPSF